MNKGSNIFEKSPNKNSWGIIGNYSLSMFIGVNRIRTQISLHSFLYELILKECNKDCSLFLYAYQFVIDTTANCTFRHRNLNAHSLYCDALLAARCTNFSSDSLTRISRDSWEAVLNELIKRDAVNAFATLFAIFRDIEPLWLWNFPPPLFFDRERLPFLKIPNVIDANFCTMDDTIS